MQSDPAIAEEEPQLPAQVFIAGSERARGEFHAPFQGPFRLVHGAITCDLTALSALRRHRSWRWLIVVRFAREVREALSALQPCDVLSDRVLVAAVVDDVAEIVAVRRDALQVPGTGVVVKSAGEEGRAVEVTRRVLTLWENAGRKGVEPDQEEVRRVWGEPAFKPDSDMVIPPGWDSEGKIRAVADAVGVEYESAGAGGEGQGEGCRLTFAPDEQEELERAREEKREGMEVHEKRMERFGELLDAATPGPGADGDVKGADPAAEVDSVHEVVNADSRPQSDFFQQLLSGGRR